MTEFGIDDLSERISKGLISFKVPLSDRNNLRSMSSNTIQLRY